MRSPYQISASAASRQPELERLSKPLRVRVAACNGVLQLGTRGCSNLPASGQRPQPESHRDEDAPGLLQARVRLAPVTGRELSLGIAQQPVELCGLLHQRALRTAEIGRIPEAESQRFRPAGQRGQRGLHHARARERRRGGRGGRRARGGRRLRDCERRQRRAERHSGDEVSHGHGTPPWLAIVYRGATRVPAPKSGVLCLTCQGRRTKISTRCRHYMRGTDAAGGGNGQNWGPVPGAPPHTSVTYPCGCQNVSLSACAAGIFGVSSCGSWPSRGGTFSSGESVAPVSKRK